MKIHKFAYYNGALDWKLEPISFGNLTLLIGISGVGKTQILEAIRDMQKIANGESLNGTEWDISFSTQTDIIYRWIGKFENKDLSLASNYSRFFEIDNDVKRNRSKIIEEKLYLNDQCIIDRNESQILFKGTKTLKLSPFKSILDLLNQEDEIGPAQDSLNKIVHFNNSFKETLSSYYLPIEFSTLAKKYKTLESIQNSNLLTEIKLALVNKNVPDIFEKIKRKFISVFPQVEDLRTEFMRERVALGILNPYPLLQIKEKDVKSWILLPKISSGMLKTLRHICDFYLWPKGTVILIDEFENSLGVNCIDLLTEDLLEENKKLQFIITSHHPYIINNISTKYWKIVTRKGGHVQTYDTSELDLDKSSHKAFIQLMNSEKYREGIEVG